MSNAVKMQPILTLEDFDPFGPIKTLGWTAIEWIEAWLVMPDGDNAGEPFRLTHEQKNFLLWFYAVDATGRFRYRRGVLRRAKGWGKSPFLAAVALFELCGPARFSHWVDGARNRTWDMTTDCEPVGQPHAVPWIVLAGVSEAQTANTFDAIRAMISPEMEAEYGLDVGATRIFKPGGGKVVIATSSAATLEGGRCSFAILDETHHWTGTDGAEGSAGNGGRKLARVIRRNLAKMNGRSIETTNAHEPSGDPRGATVAESSYLAYLAMKEGRSREKGLLYDSREAPYCDLADEEALKEALRCAYGDATWIDIDRLVGEVYDPNTPPEEARRFYLNQIVAAANAWVRPDQWAANLKRDLAPLKHAPHGQWRLGDKVTLGFDGGRTDDSTALVAMRMSDGAAFLLGLWEKPEGPDGNNWEVDKELVREAVDEAFATLNVIAFFCDVMEWETDVDYWREQYGERLKVKATAKHATAWDMRHKKKDSVMAAEALWRAIVDCEVPHNGDERLARHVGNARRRPGMYGVSFGKASRESPLKVDAVAAMMLARVARTVALGSDLGSGPGTLRGAGGWRGPAAGNSRAVPLTPTQIRALEAYRRNRST